MNIEIDIIDYAVKNPKVSFMLNTVFWKSFDKTIKTYLNSTPAWSEVKFLDESGNLNDAIREIPNNTGGIYMFIVKPEILPNSLCYLMYIGRSMNTTSRNLRKRIREYYEEFQKIERPKVYRMLNNWSEFLYIRYLPLEKNSDIEKIEAELVNKLSPPFNDAIPDKIIRDYVKMF